MDEREIKVKNGVTGEIDFVSRELSRIINWTVKHDDLKIFIKKADYNVSNNHY